MCGIAGIFARNENLTVSKEELTALTDALSHRGPDSEGFYVNPNRSIALGHRRLSIIDLTENARQPMTNEDGTLWLVLNGEIYNYQELRKSLEKKGHRFVSQSDTEVILHLYEEHGTSCVQHLRGMFSFALWDEKKKRLFLARDRIGKKPLYYASTPHSFYFSSELNSLMESSHIRRDIDLVALDLFLTYSYIPSPYSIFKGVRKLPPAHFLLVEKGKLRTERYWIPRFTPKTVISFEEAKIALLEKLREATQIRLRSDVPVGCFLSGGVDSSSIVAILSKDFGLKVRTFTIGFPDAEYDETGYARTVADLFKTEHEEFVVRPDAVEILPSLIRHYGEPFGDSSALATWYLSACTSRHVKVALNGDGSDEIFAGYNWYHTSQFLKRTGRMVPPMLSAVFLPLLAGFRKGSWPSKVARLFELIGKDSPSRCADLRALLKLKDKRKLYSRDFLENLDEQAECYISRYFDESTGADELDRMQYTDTMTYLPEEVLVKVDRATMAHSLEGRSPFLDYELLEMVAKFPSSFKYNHGITKYILKQAMGKYFPPGFLDRDKMCFAVPLRDWFRRDLKTFALEAICDGGISRLPFFNLHAVRDLIGEHVRGVRNHDFQIWNLLVLSQWAQIYL